jgi:hypothetical protein
LPRFQLEPGQIEDIMAYLKTLVATGRQKTKVILNGGKESRAAAMACNGRGRARFVQR